MIYTKNVNKAIKLAYKAHMGQEDKSGLPYILHPVHLAEQMDTENECIAALLHDVVEDTDVTIEKLEKEFPKEAIDAVKLLTHDKSTDYFEYINKIKENSIARKVKLADLRHNADLTRLETITQKDLDRIEKYKKAMKILSE